MKFNFKFKLLYQQMLLFFVMIICFLTIVGALVFHLTKENVYQDTWNRMEGYAQSIRKNALELTTNQNGETEITLDAQELRDSEMVLENSDVHFTIYTSPDQILYPQYGFKSKISKKDWKRLQKGEILKRRDDLGGVGRVGKKAPHPDPDNDLVKHRMTDIFVPCFDVNGQLVAVISVASAVSNIQSDFQKIRENLLIALLVCAVIGFIICYLIAYYITKRIKKMQKATRQIAEGDFDVQIKHGDHDELDELAKDFNQMANSLKLSQEEIKRQEERRKEFLANAAHEMRTPLTTINGLLEGLKYHAIPENKIDESIDLMSNETKRLVRLVNENLDYERIRSGQLKLNLTTFNAANELEKICRQLNQKAEKENDKFVVNIKGKVPVYADYDRFTQICFNIIQNAIQFTQNGTITITATHSDEEHGTIIKIADTGIGMSQGQLNNIWERYYKVDPSRAQTKGESGLGLAIVHQLMQQHHGKINVESTEGKGTTFTLFFPDK
ncbi:ATP-binding protein [Ligilactobacillus sp. LYQ135]